MTYLNARNTAKSQLVQVPFLSIEEGGHDRECVKEGVVVKGWSQLVNIPIASPF